jgi:hypothetical protein
VKRGYKAFHDLKTKDSGLGWDDIKKKTTAPDSVWDEYIKVNTVFEFVD